MFLLLAILPLLAPRRTSIGTQRRSRQTRAPIGTLQRSTRKLDLFEIENPGPINGQRKLDPFEKNNLDPKQKLLPTCSVVCRDEYDAKISKLERETSERISILESQLKTLMADFAKLNRRSDPDSMFSRSPMLQGHNSSTIVHESAEELLERELQEANAKSCERGIVEVSKWKRFKNKLTKIGSVCLPKQSILEKFKEVKQIFYNVGLMPKAVWEGNWKIRRNAMICAVALAAFGTSIALFPASGGLTATAATFGTILGADKAYNACRVVYKKARELGAINN